MPNKKSCYTFKIEDTNYINALVAYLGHLNIENLTASGDSSYINLLVIASLDQLKANRQKIDELPNILAKIKEQGLGNIQLTLTTHYDTLLSLQRVLPEFEPQACAEDPALTPIVKKLQNHINEATMNPTGCWYFGINDPIPVSLTREQVWTVLALTHKEAPFTSAVDLPSENSIVILTQNATNFFVIHYDTNLTINRKDIYFDMNLGFLSGYSYSGENEVTALTMAFNDWVKNNNREGDIFAFPKKIKSLSQAIREGTPLIPGIIGIITDYAYLSARPLPILVKRIQVEEAPPVVEEPAQKRQKLE